MATSTTKHALALTLMLAASSTSHAAGIPVLGDIIGSGLPEIGLTNPDNLMALTNVEGNMILLQGLAAKGIDILSGGSIPLVGSFENAIVLGGILTGEIIENNVTSGNFPLFDDLLGGALSGGGGLPF